MNILQDILIKEHLLLSVATICFRSNCSSTNLCPRALPRPQAKSIANTYEGVEIWPLFKSCQISTSPFFTFKENTSCHIFFKTFNIKHLHSLKKPKTMAHEI